MANQPYEVLVLFDKKHQNNVWTYLISPYCTAINENLCTKVITGIQELSENLHCYIIYTRPMTPVTSLESFARQQKDISLEQLTDGTFFCKPKYQ